MVFISIRASQLYQLDQGPRVVLIRCSYTDLAQFGPDGLRDNPRSHKLSFIWTIQRSLAPSLMRNTEYYASDTNQNISAISTGVKHLQREPSLTEDLVPLIDFTSVDEVLRAPRPQHRPNGHFRYADTSLKPEA
jgi:hypothetical protein